MSKMKATDKNLFVLSVSRNGRVCGIGRVDTMQELLEAVLRNNTAAFTTGVRHLDLRGLCRVIDKMMPAE